MQLMHAEVARFMYEPEAQWPQIQNFARWGICSGMISNVDVENRGEGVLAIKAVHYIWQKISFCYIFPYHGFSHLTDLSFTYL